MFSLKIEVVYLKILKIHVHLMQADQYIVCCLFVNNEQKKAPIWVHDLFL